MRVDRPSSTATLIAAATVFLSRDPRLADLVSPDAAELCARCLEAVSPRRLAAVELVARPGLRWAARLGERATIPGLLLHFILRKRWIEGALRAALAGGIEQVVVVGAGFDTLAARLAPEFPRACFTEVDHPATQRAKRATFASRSNLSFIAADLAHTDLQAALTNSLEPEKPSLFIVEGLLMYLADDEIAALFDRLAALQRSGGRLVFTQMEPAPDGRSRFHNATALATALLSLWSEPFKSALPRSEAAQFLAKAGYRLKEVADHEKLREAYLDSKRKNLPLAQGEMLFLAER